MQLCTVKNNSAQHYALYCTQLALTHALNSATTVEAKACVAQAASYMLKCTEIENGIACTCYVRAFAQLVQRAQ